MINLAPIDSTQYDLSDLPEGVAGNSFRRQVLAMFDHGTKEQIENLIDYYQGLKDPPQEENAYALYFTKVITSLQALREIRITEAAHANEFETFLLNQGKAITEMQHRHSIEMQSVKQTTLMVAGKPELQTSETEPAPPVEEVKEPIPIEPAPETPHSNS